MPDTAMQALTDAITEGTELDTHGVPDEYAEAIHTWLTREGWALVELPPADATYRITGGEVAENDEWYAYVRVPQGLLDGVPLGDFHTLGPALAAALLAAAQSAEAL